jgi:RND family efflux transporter MFP subunit
MLGVDLQRLRIDRGERSAAPRRARSFPFWLVVVLGVVGAGFYFREPIRGYADRWTLPRVEVALVRRESPSAGAVGGTAANGYIVARRRAALSADTPGRIVELNVEEGSVVKKGDVVARLYSEEYSAALRRAEADLEASHTALQREEREAEAVQAALAELAATTRMRGAELAEANANLGLAVLDLARAQKLVEENVVSTEHVDNARAEHESAKARVQAAEAGLLAAQAAEETGASNASVAGAAVEEAKAHVKVMEATREQAAATLAKTEVRAPFDGIVVLKDAEVGEVVSPNTSGGTSARGSVATMVDFASLEVQVEVQETSLAAVRIGSDALIYLDAWPERAYRGRVERIWPTANRQKGTVEVRISILTPDERLRPEMGVRAVFDPKLEGDRPPSAEGAPPSLLVPQSALVRAGPHGHGGPEGVFVLEGETVRFRQVRVGARPGERAAIEEGLEEGQRIVLDPPDKLADGDRVLVLQ